ncbi:MAG: UbiA family prenyltransferase, partial [Actinomycetia bacterium]|nr:UbiA family prenyltransferase [Actinomycetes bacterium]
MKKYFLLIRPREWIKNLFVIAPLIFSGNLLNINNLITISISFMAFCMISSSIYIINDIADIENDRKHPVKKFRPLASREITKNKAFIISLLLLGAAFTFAYFTNIKFTSIIIIYFLINILYSFFLKN